jgi:hypothetical protein
VSAGQNHFWLPGTGSMMMAAAAGGRILSREEADQELARLQSEQDEISAALLELERHPGYLLLDGGHLSGTTLAQWTQAKAKIGMLWEGLAAHQRVLQTASGLRASHRHLGPAELAELTELLNGDSAELTGPEIPLEQRALLDGPQKVERLSLTALVARMNAGFRESTEVVATAEKAWTEQTARLSAAETSCAAANALVTDLGLRPGADKAATVAARITDELAQARARVVADPLAACQNGSVRTEFIDRLEREADDVRDELADAAATRAGFDDLAVRIGALVDTLAAAEASLRATCELVRQKIASPALPDIAERAASLRDQLAALTGVRQACRWTELAQGAAAVQRDAASTLERVQTAAAQAAAPLHERDELRGRLDAYRAKAAATGRAEDLALAAAYEQAHELLWTAPCDLARARAVVLGYQAAITRPAPADLPSQEKGHASERM